MAVPDGSDPADRSVFQEKRLAERVAVPIELAAKPPSHCTSIRSTIFVSP